MRYSTTVLLFFSLVFLAGCDVHIASENASPTPIFVTATLPAAAIPLPTHTPPLPTPVPTIAPIEGVTTTQVNVRAETSTASSNLGSIAQFSKVQIIGRDSSTSWYQIIYAGAPNGTGWIRAEYVQVNAGAEIPVIESVSGSGTGESGFVIQKINVRSGPGTTFDTLGELNPNDVVFILGKDESGAWMQIEFENSADGIGWAALEFLRVENTDSLPVVAGAIPTMEVATTTTATQSDVVLSAMADGDSKIAPLARIFFSPQGARSVQINDSVSTPNGDTEDWIEFTSYNGSIAIQLFCSNGTLQVELQDGTKVIEKFLLACTQAHFLNVPANQSHLLRLSEADASVTHLTNYTLVMESIK
ncbi:MAG: SH3 domain-containing protein [Anaerolineales bacterium]|nr:SH3 domain-containing protein [Anaerolineales bacterium]